MPWRKWFVRGLVFLVVAACLAALYWYQLYTNPSAVRQQVLAKFQDLFPGAEVSVEGARLQIMGAISVHDIRLARRDDPEREEIARIPSAILHHDKEKVLDGAMTLRKIELQRPRLMLVRRPDGGWNLQGLAKVARPDVALPTVVIHQGTLVFVDKAENGTGLALEVHDVNLTLINDPVSVINIDGAATFPIAGRIHFHGRCQRDSGELTFSLKANKVPLNSDWSDKLACAKLNDKLQGLALEGKVDVKVELAYRPGESEPLSYDVRLEVQDATLRHPKIPLALEELEAILHVAAGEVRLEKLKARSGTGSSATTVEGRGFARLPCLEQDWEAHLELKHVPVNDAMVAPLPEKLRKLQDLFNADGHATIRLDACFKDGRWAPLPDGTPSVVTLQPENGAATFERFPCPLSGITGAISHDLGAQKTDVNVTAFVGSRPVFITGKWEGIGERASCSFDIVGNELIIDEKILAAIPAAQQKRIRSFHPTGKVDIKYHLSREPHGEFLNEFHLKLQNGTLRWDDFDYRLGNVNGFIDIYPDRNVEFRDFSATHKNGGKLFLNGRATPRKDGSYGLVMNLAGRQVAMDDDLKKALARIPVLAKTWDALRPRGRMNFSASIDRTAPAWEDMEVTLVVQGCTACPTFFAYTFEECAGKFRYHRNRLDIERLYARRRDTEISIVQGAVETYPGGFYADLTDIRFRNLSVDEEFIQACPRALQGAMKSMNVQGTLTGKTRLVVAQDMEPGTPPDIFWDGQLWFNDLTFNTGLEVSQAGGTLACRGRFDGRQIIGINGNLILNTAMLLKQPFRNVHAGLFIYEEQPQTLLVNLRAPVHGGDVTGQIRLEFGGNLRYDLNLTASQIDLGLLGRQLMGSESQLSGVVIARLVLSGTGAGISSLEGSGTLDVPRGRILNLPLLLDLLKFLGLRWPDRTAFEEVHAAFAVHGRRVNVSRLELLGSAVSLYGKGEFNLDGTDLALDFYPSWARVEQVLPPAIRAVPPAITKNLLTIEMRGKVGTDKGDLQFHKIPLPLVVDPLLHLRDWIGGGPAVSQAPRRGPGPVPRKD